MSSLNQMHWRGQRGHYEVWYLTFHDAGSGWAFWFRYTLNVPPAASEPAEGLLWAFAFPPDGEEGALQLLDRYPIERVLDRSNGRFAIEIGRSRFESSSNAGLARGVVGSGDRKIAWDLTLGPSVAEGFRHVPPMLYRLKVASSAVASPGLKFTVDGTVTVGERTITLSGALGEQGHVYGRRHAYRWTWAHCHDFADAPGAVFEGVSAQVQKAGFLLPAASPLLFHAGPGRRFEWNRPQSLWTTHSAFALGEWVFEAEQNDVRLRGTISAPPESYISVEYRDPDGTPLYCNHTEVADVTLDLLRKRGLAWELEERFESKGKTAFEYGERERDPRPRRRLDHVEARPA